MYGLPRQSLHDVEATVRKAASLSPDRVSVFGYAHVPWFKKHQRVIDQADLPGTAERFEQAEAAAGALQARGYARVGFDHFALAGDPLAKAAAQGALRRNFQGYTTDPADLLIGLGASSIGSLPQGFVQNEPHLGKYEAAIAQNRLPVVRGIAVDEDDRLRAEVIERLMCEMKADLGSICAAHGFAPDTLDTAFADLAPLVSDGLVTRQDRTIAVTEKGRALVRNVAACFDTYLAAKRHGSKHSRAV
jgi:oxygen-independent coproporphyrinogen-3 oxidase